MWASIIQFFANLFGFWKSKEDRAAKEAEILNQKEFRAAKEKARVVERADDHEKLVAAVKDNSPESLAALDEIRKRLGK